MARMRSSGPLALLVVAVGAVLACRDRPAPIAAERTAATSSASDAGHGAAATIPTALSVPSAAAPGVFHAMQGTVDSEPNLELFADHTFYFSTNNTDMVVSARGIWRADGARLLLLPAAGETTFSIHFQRATDRITVDRDGDDLILSGVDVVSSDPTSLEPFRERYRRGRMCEIAPSGSGASPVASCP